VSSKKKAYKGEEGELFEVSFQYSSEDSKLKRRLTDIYIAFKQKNKTEEWFLSELEKQTKKELKKFGEEIASAESRWLGEPGRAEIRAIVKKLLKNY